MSQGFVNKVIVVGGGGNVGDFVYSGGTSVPAGCLQCDGSAVSRTTYSALFSVIGTTWGVGDGSTTFNLPDGARNVLVGSGGSGTGTLGNAVGDTGGAETHTLIVDEIPAHTHTYGGTQSQGTTSGNIILSTGGSAFVSGSTGGGSAHNIMQPSMVGLCCIRYEPVAVTTATAANQADQESASSSVVFTNPASQQFHPSAAKAWVYYNQATGPSVVGSYNVTSVTDDSTGNFTVNWANDFADTNYTAIASTVSAGGGNNLIGIGAGSTKTVGATSFSVVQLVSNVDVDRNAIVAFGELA